MTIKSRAIIATAVFCGTCVGIHLNNPGNIMNEPGLHFIGESKPYGRRDTFISPELGYRAMSMVLLHYNTLPNCCSLSQVITRYAPPNENPTRNYINFVAKECDFTTWSHLNLQKENVLFPLVKAMAKFEQGKSFHDSDETILRGVRMALHDSRN
ncbi:MAG TPA: structural protein [Bacteroidia bacterium]|jgi:hypothetical protein|nr:structural protein [Bacteroidia bacterium]